MASIELTGDEQSLILLLLDREIRRQGEQQKLDVNKRNPNYEAANSAQRVINRLKNLRDKIDAATASATPEAATASATTTFTTAVTDTPVRPGRGRRVLQPRQQD